MSDGLPPPIQSQVARECPHCLQAFVGMILIPELTAPELPARVTQSQIELEGMGSEIIRLRTENPPKTMEQIAEITHYSVDQVRRFLQEYQNALPVQRQQVIERSIWNVAGELQRNYADLIGLIRTLDDNPDLELKIRTEMRKHMEFGAKLVDRLEELKRDGEAKAAIMDILQRFFKPGERQEAIAAIQQYRQALNLGRGTGV